MGLDKRFLIDQLAARLRQSDEVARRAGAEAREAARSLQTESEKKEDGRAAIEFGVYGAPETFFIDARGMVQYRHVGPMTPEVWEHEFLSRLPKRGLP